uniref:Toxin candidate TRINITY_DN37459_c0_g2_i7 n=1 Tax=Pachycerianthus maua TaxID=2736681 RepID=A0A7G7WZ55_9CNID|nr:toxin candidate TRINITY_DN37459_c0_g2_i7 [Pachycerianthus maua]
MQLFLFLCIGWVLSPTVYSHDVPYLYPMILGRSFDITRYSSGVEVFPENSQSIVISQQMSDSEIRIVRSSNDAKNVLSVSGSLSLQIKTGLLSVKGSGSYLKDTSSREKMVEVLVRVKYKTVTETLAENAEPYSDWFDRANIAGKHYVRAITYGGELIASLQFNSKSTVEKEKIEAALSAGIEIGGGGILDAKVEGHFKRAIDMATDNSDMTIKYFSTTHLEEQPQDLDSFLKAINDFPEKVRETNGGKGVPIVAHLHPLSSLRGARPIFNYRRDRGFVSSVNSLEDDYDDIISAMTTLDNWLRKQECSLLADQATQLADLHKNLLSVNRAFVKFVSNVKFGVDDSAAMNSMINEVKTAYRGTDNGFVLPGKYSRQLRAIISAGPPESLLKARLLGYVTFVEYSINMEAVMNENSVSKIAECHERINGHETTKDFVQAANAYTKLFNGYVPPLVAVKKETDDKFLPLDNSDIYQKDYFMVRKDNGFLAGRASLNLVTFQFTKPDNIPSLSYNVENIRWELDNRGGKTPVVAARFSYTTDTDSCDVSPKFTASTGAFLTTCRDSEDEIRFNANSGGNVQPYSAGNGLSYLNSEMLFYYHVDVCSYENMQTIGKNICPFAVARPLPWHELKKKGNYQGGGPGNEFPANTNSILPPSGNRNGNNSGRNSNRRPPPSNNRGNNVNNNG